MMHLKGVVDEVRESVDRLSIRRSSLQDRQSLITISSCRSRTWSRFIIEYSCCPGRYYRCLKSQIIRIDLLRRVDPQ